MYYEIRHGHDLPFDPLKAIVAPRPVGWISTLSADGVPNLAPYSFFNMISGRPPILMFSSDGRKDSYTNARDTGEFVFNLATMSQLDAMNRSSAPVPPEVSEFESGQIAMADSRLVKAPRVADAPAALELKVIETRQLKDIDGQPINNFLVMGQVVSVHIRDEFLQNGRFHSAGARPLARLGYRDYAVITETFELGRPGD